MISARRPREFLLDVSRLVWRVWGGRLPTGIDRVCLEYAEHFRARSQAVVQFKGSTFVFDPEDSDRLFSILLRGFGRRARTSLLFGLGPAAWLRARTTVPRRGMFYLNVGHTGLDRPDLPAWITRNGLRAIYLIHDLIPITHPQFCRPGELKKHERRMSNALASASGIIGNSQATLDDLSDFAHRRGLPMPPAVVALISGHRPSPHVLPSKLDRPFFVTIGTIEGRKNHIILLMLWRRLVADIGRGAPILLVIGQRGWEAESAFALLDDRDQWNGAVREIARADDEELASWIGGARALLMPSFAEGFGLPVIEALQAGTPVIASDLPVFREIAGDMPTYLDPSDGLAWEAAIRDFCGATPERDRQLGRIPGFQAPTWPNHFRIVEDWLETLN
jgi:glycosyltransferase involved in cell wall biosynthesis